MIAIDNTTVVAYISKQGGTHSHTLLRLHVVVYLFLWLQTQNIAIRARHIIGCLNVIAEHLSWPNQPITTDCCLHPEIVTQILGTWGTPTVDMFATVHNMHLGASSTGDTCSVTGLVNVHVSTIPPAKQSHSKTQDHPGVRSDTNSPWWPHNRGFHIYYVFVWTTLFVQIGKKAFVSILLFLIRSST